MIEKEKNEMRETEAAFVLTIVLMNVLLLAVFSALIWFMYFVIRENHSLDAILRGRLLP